MISSNKQKRIKMDVTTYTDKIRVRHPETPESEGTKLTQLVVIDGQISIFSPEHYIVIGEDKLFDLLLDFGEDSLGTRSATELHSLAEKYLETIKEAK